MSFGGDQRFRYVDLGPAIDLRDAAVARRVYPTAEGNRDPAVALAAEMVP